MAGERRRVSFVSSGPLGVEALKWLEGQDCELAYISTHDVPPQPGWRHDLGLNFLGTHRVPAVEVGDGRRWVNFHPAPLPEYGGRNVAYHAIMEGAKEFGATVHYMSPEFDTGDIIECIRFPIRPSDTAGDLMARAKAELVEMFKEWVPRLLQGPVPAIPQEGKTRYYPQQPIDNYIRLFPDQQRDVRALTCPPHSTKIMIAGKNYKIIPEEE